MSQCYLYHLHETSIRLTLTQEIINAVRAETR